MGNLIPGAQYVYERVDNIVYAREFGKNERTLVGYTHDEKTLQQLKMFHETQLWKDILKEAATNKTLEEALEKVKVLYYLMKDNGSKT